MKKFYEVTKDLRDNEWELIGKFEDTIYTFNNNMCVYEKQSAAGDKDKNCSFVIGTINDYDVIALGELRAKQLIKSGGTIVPVRRFLHRHKATGSLVEEYVLLTAGDDISLYYFGMISKEKLEMFDNITSYIGEQIVDVDDTIIRCLPFVANKNTEVNHN